MIFVKHFIYSGRNSFICNCCERNYGEDMTIEKDMFKAALGHLIGLTGKAMRLRLDHNLAEAGYDLTAVYMILLKHIDYEEGVNQQTLTDHLCLDKTSMTRFIDALELRNLVVRVPDKTDRRQKMIYLTNEGKKLIGPVDQIARKTEEQALQDIDPEKVRICKEVLRQVRENLEK